MVRRRLFTVKGTLQNQQVSAASKLTKRFRVSRIRRINQCFLICSKPNCETFTCVRRLKSFKAHFRERIDLVVDGDFMQLNRKRLIKQAIIIRVVESVQDSFQSLAAEDSERFGAPLRLRGPFHPEQQRRQSAAMIKMQVA